MHKSHTFNVYKSRVLVDSHGFTTITINFRIFSPPTKQPVYLLTVTSILTTLIPWQHSSTFSFYELPTLDMSYQQNKKICVLSWPSSFVYCNIFKLWHTSVSDFLLPHNFPLYGYTRFYLSVGDRQGCLVCCSPWGCKESDTTQQVNWSDLSVGGHWGCFYVLVIKNNASMNTHSSF